MNKTTRQVQIEEMLAAEPDDTFLRYGMAMEYISQGDDDQAVCWLRDLLTIDPHYVPAYQQAGQALVRLDRKPEACDYWTRGIAAARHQGDIHAAEEMQGFLAALA
jgi:Tfp pilus assembly protein PilF